MNGDEKSFFSSFYNLRVIVIELNFKFAIQRHIFFN